MSIARQHLLLMYQQALAAVQGDVCTRNALNEIGLTGPQAVIAIGKAAQSMMQGAICELGEQIVAGLIISKPGHINREGQDNTSCENTAGIFDDSRFITITSGHPVPDEHSLRAGMTLLSFMEKQAAKTDLIFLISGGASSLVEVLPEGMNLSQLQSVNRWLLSSGLDIHDMNHLRRAFSCIKGGRLAAYLQGRPTRCLMISDVPGDHQHIIGSGLLFSPDIDSPLEDSLESASLEESFSTSTFPGMNVPAWIKQLPQAPPAPVREAFCYQSVKAKIIATMAQAKQAAMNEALALGYSVIRHDEVITGDALTVGRQLAKQLLVGPPGVHVWGGETTVKLPDHPGRGGRNQHLALAVADVIAGHTGYCFMAAGTDGSDGPTLDAGALIDAETTARAKKYRFDVTSTLQSANAGSFLTASGDVVHTGPTGTNVMDIMLGLKP
ncbi:MAG: DUF4147 domain-containing protein [Ectothiorhodospiraceae bacterium]|nr:DUF4147 domain-containing protein [Ectothiorhodospiraceae bacterium]